MQGNPTGSSSNSSQVRRPARSKNGCVTCRRRKVRCDEQRPRCSHCERLNLHCQWRPLVYPVSPASVAAHRRAPSTPTAQPSLLCHQHPSSGSRPQDLQSPDNLGSVASPTNQLSQSQAAQVGSGVDQFFDYASFMWSEGGIWGPLGMGIGDEWIEQNSQQPATPANVDAGRRVDLTMRDANTQLRNQAADAQANQTPLPAANSVELSVLPGEDGDLLTYFVNTVVPPILAEVETQKKWGSMRRVLLSMAVASPMVRHAILAFSSLLRCRRETPWLQVGQHYYENAAAELGSVGDWSGLKAHSSRRQNLLATLFFLCYIDILEERMETTHKNLKRAYLIFRQGNMGGFHPVEMHLLSWIRLLDARAVSAGGEGLFLTDKDESLLVQPSPSSLDDGHDAGEPAGGDTAAASDPHNDASLAGGGLDRDIEDVLFELLYQPGVVFYQKVQSFMGRISKIDPWHRSRGTVEDETEVMNVAAAILGDLRALLADGSPALMRHAVRGQLRAPHVSPALAFAVTRAFRSYLSNYHASKVHLHRVAYRHLPLTAETTDALAQIRHLARLMVQDAGSEPGLEQVQPLPSRQEQSRQQPAPISDPAGSVAGVPDEAAAATAADAPSLEPANGCGDVQAPAQTQAPAGNQTTLPVNMLWPLLMWGTEEKDPAERGWIREQILRMEKVASNARATAQVLEEVQRRQDASGARQDVRAVMHAVFDSCWAIV